MPRPLLLSCEAISKAFGTRSLFDGLTFGRFEGDQAGLVGPNGSGKSTLLKILAGVTTPDAGSRSVRGGVRVGYVPQDPVFAEGGTVDDVVRAALDGVDEDDRPGRVAQALGRAGFTDARAEVDALSGGWKKRLAIARELAAAPDVLLMDEPTNHLDVEGILWLEGVLTERARACLVVSHDRYFLEHVATRMLELNRAYPDGLLPAEGRYSEFLARRDEFLRGQAAYQESLANTVRREIEWLRRGAKARSTKAKGRIKEAARLIDELQDRRARGVTATAGIDFVSSQRRTRRLLVARSLTKSLGGRRLVSDLDLVITPGTRVGLIGPNGSGKTTLLNLLAGALPPDAGEIERADQLRIVRFEQARSGLDPTESLRRTRGPAGAEQGGAGGVRARAAAAEAARVPRAARVGRHGADDPGRRAHPGGVPARGRRSRDRLRPDGAPAALRGARGRARGRGPALRALGRAGGEALTQTAPSSTTW